MRAKGLADILFGRARGALLGLLYGRPDRSFFYREITRQLSGFSTGTLQRELGTLVRLKLVDRSRVGKQVFYRANQNHAIFPDLKALVAKTIGAIQVLGTAMVALGEKISIAFIYGSLARGDERADSDIDLMVLGTVQLEELLLQLSDAESSLGRAINPTVYPIPEFKKKLASGNHFLNSVFRGEKVFLIGDEDELAKMGGVRLVEGRAHQP